MLIRLIALAIATTYFQKRYMRFGKETGEWSILAWINAELDKCKGNDL